MLKFDEYFLLCLSRKCIQYVTNIVTVYALQIKTNKRNNIPESCMFAYIKLITYIDNFSFLHRHIETFQFSTTTLNVWEEFEVWYDVFLT